MMYTLEEVANELDEMACVCYDRYGQSFHGERYENMAMILRDCFEFEEDELELLLNILNVAKLMLQCEVPKETNIEQQEILHRILTELTKENQ